MIGFPHLHLRETDSTNARAKELAAAGVPHGMLVTADAQSAGRGRQGRTWSAPAGSALLMSVVLRKPPELLPLIAAVAVAEVVGASAQVKWPNDVLLDGRKVCGILVEGRPQEGWAVLGIGLNVAVAIDDLPPELHLTAGTLGLEIRDVSRIRAELLTALDRWLGSSDGAVLEAWRSRDGLRGREITWTDGSGVAQGIDGEGRLVVALADGGQTTLGAGEVHLGLSQDA